MPERFDISEERVGALKEVFDRLSERKSKLIPAPRILDFHHKYISSLIFDVQLDPESLSALVHPYQGYMCNVEEKKYSFGEILGVYEDMLVATYERSLG